MKTIYTTFFTAWVALIVIPFALMLLASARANGAEEPACISPRNTNSILCRGK